MSGHKRSLSDDAMDLSENVTNMVVTHAHHISPHVWHTQLEWPFDLPHSVHPWQSNM